MQMPREHPPSLRLPGSDFVVNTAAAPGRAERQLRNELLGRRATGPETTLLKHFANRKRSLKDELQHCQLCEVMRWPGY